MSMAGQIRADLYKTVRSVGWYILIAVSLLTAVLSYFFVRN